MSIFSHQVSSVIYHIAVLSLYLLMFLCHDDRYVYLNVIAILPNAYIIAIWRRIHINRSSLMMSLLNAIRYTKSHPLYREHSQIIFSGRSFRRFSFLYINASRSGMPPAGINPISWDSLTLSRRINHLPVCIPTPA